MKPLRRAAGAAEQVEGRHKRSIVSIIFQTVFAVPLAFSSALSTSGAASVRLLGGMAQTFK